MTRPSLQIPTLDDDQLLTPAVGDWAEEKYRLLKLYTTLFTISMRGKWDSLVYLDLFAGAGRSRIRTSGRIVPASPLLAMSLDQPFDQYVFCESDPRRMSALRQRVVRQHPGVGTCFVEGDVNDGVANVVAALPRPSHQNRVLTFCFVDPFALGNLRFTTIERLAERRMDFLVLVPSGFDATRNERIYLKPTNKTVDRFLGNPGWRTAWTEAQARGRSFDTFMTNAFGESMKRLGYRYEGIENSHPVRSTEKKLRLYRLVLFSRHPLADKFWREVRKYATPQRTLFS